MIRTLILAAVVAAILSAGAQATTDPRKCTAETPTNHAYWCAKTAATNAVRVAMARRQHVPRWFYPVSCDQAGSLLRWKCNTVFSGTIWHATVTWRATSKGWTVRTVIIPS